MTSTKIKEAVEWYSKNRTIYKALARKVVSITRDVLATEGIVYHSVASRTKSIDSYKRKAEKYNNPRNEIFDMAGIRVITYLDSDANRVHEILKKAFEMYPQHSIDKSEELGIDRMGYRSIHCVGTLGKDRLKLPENKLFENSFFEIQIRTILQHAWAEFEHDRNYKFRGVPPKKVRRRLSIMAGILEFMDREFDDIAESLESYAEDIAKKTELGELDLPIDSTSLKEYMKNKIGDLISKGIVPKFLNDKQIFEEIKDMGIDNLQDLDAIIPENYIELKSKYIGYREVLDSVIVDFLIIHNVDKYLQKAWKHHWSAIDVSDVELYKHFGIDFKKYAKRYDIEILQDSRFG